MSNLNSKRTCGPMVGHVDHRSAQLWVLPPPCTKVEVRYGPEWGGEQSVQGAAGPTYPCPVALSLSGLQADGIVHYQVFLDGETDERLGGQFRSAPLPGAKSAFSFGLSSCMKASGTLSDSRQRAWSSLLGMKPSFQILLGDNVYANSTDPKVLWKKHVQQRRISSFAHILRRVPTYAVWDDHDYGGNNSDGTETGKERSLETFHQVWVNPEAPDGTPVGVSTRWSWGDVDFFLIDGRYHRDDQREIMVGDEQFEWLSEQLGSSNATFKFIGSGSCLKRGGNGWRNYPSERARFLELVASSSGAIYMSGDVHRCRLDQVSDSRGGVVHDFISSGIGRKRTPVSKARRFVTVDVDTTLDDPTIEAVIWSRKGKRKDRKLLRHSQLD